MWRSITRACHGMQFSNLSMSKTSSAFLSSEILNDKKSL